MSTTARLELGQSEARNTTQGSHTWDKVSSTGTVIFCFPGHALIGIWIRIGVAGTQTRNSEGEVSILSGGFFSVPMQMQESRT